MKALDIRVGQTLRLKKEAVERYGCTSSLVTVSRLAYKGSYKTPLVVANEAWIDASGNTHSEAFYRPSDFQAALPASAVKAASAKLGVLG